MSTIATPYDAEIARCQGKYLTVFEGYSELAWKFLCGQQLGYQAGCTDTEARYKPLVEAAAALLGTVDTHHIEITSNHSGKLSISRALDSRIMVCRAALAALKEEA